MLPPGERPVLPCLTGFTALDSLHAAMRRRVPQVIASITPLVAAGSLPERCIVVAYRDRGPWRLIEDDDVIRWYDGPSGGLPIGFIDDIETTADAVGSVMGATVRSKPDDPV